jgi:hypothetical protein
VPVDPSLFASVPFGSKTAYVDFCGTLQLYFKALADQVFALTGNAMRLYPIGDGGGDDWLHAVQQQFVSCSLALGLGSPPDLSSFDLAVPEDHASFFFSVAQELRVLRSAAGLP